MELVGGRSKEPRRRSLEILKEGMTSAAVAEEDSEDERVTWRQMIG